jgi:hypothetical protein
MVPDHIEVRAKMVVLYNDLSATGAPGTPGKYSVLIESVNETQTADNQRISESPREHVRFDPMAHATVEIPGTGMTAGQIMGLFLAAVDHFKAGVPPAIIDGVAP